MAWLPAGRFNKRITIQEAIDGQGETFGNATLTWTDVTTVWAALEPLTGLEKVSSDQVAAGITHKVTIRYRPGVTTKMRLLFRGREFNIMSAINLEERNRQIVLMGMEAV